MENDKAKVRWWREPFGKRRLFVVYEKEELGSSNFVCMLIFLERKQNTTARRDVPLLPLFFFVLRMESVYDKVTFLGNV